MNNVSMLRCRLISIGITNIEITTVLHLMYHYTHSELYPGDHLSLQNTLLPLSEFQLYT